MFVGTEPSFGPGIIAVCQDTWLTTYNQTFSTDCFIRHNKWDRNRLETLYSSKLSHTILFRAFDLCAKLSEGSLNTFF